MSCTVSKNLGQKPKDLVSVSAKAPASKGQEPVNWSRTRDILISIICIGIILWYAWGLLLGLFVHAVVLLLLSMAVAFLLTPGVNFLEKRGNLPRAVATLAIYVVVLVVLGSLGYALVF